MSRFCLIVLGMLAVAHAIAAPFLNLDFESGRTNSVQFLPAEPDRGVGPAADLLPGWQVLLGATRVETIGFNYQPLTGPYVSLVAAGEVPGPAPRFGVDGRYAVRVLSNPRGPDEYSLAQRADVPLDAPLLAFKFSQFGFRPSMEGELLPPVGSAPNYSASEALVMFDASRFAGRNVELTLRAINSGDPLAAGDFHYLDSISFVIPEPTAAVLFAGGLAALILWKRRRDFRS